MRSEDMPDKLRDEDEEWLRMTPAQRLLESGRLWALYLALGGSLDPEPDPQSPFYFPELNFCVLSIGAKLFPSPGVYPPRCAP